MTTGVISAHTNPTTSLTKVLHNGRPAVLWECWPISHRPLKVTAAEIEFDLTKTTTTIIIIIINLYIPHRTEY